MILTLLVLGELLLLYLLSRRLTQELFNFLLLVFRHRTIALTILTIILFPGTVVHELSHLFVAEVLGVHTGKLTLAPEALEGDEIRTGSVAIVHTDPFRRYAIGLAPVFIGLLLLTALSFWAPTVMENVTKDFSWSTLFSNPWTYYLIFGSYALFAISNTMFSSPEDLKGFIPFAITLTLIIAAAFIAGVRIALTGKSLDIVVAILTSLTRNMGVILAINLILLLTMRILVVLTGKITKTKLVPRNP